MSTPLSRISSYQWKLERKLSMKCDHQIQSLVLRKGWNDKWYPNFQPSDKLASTLFKWIKKKKKGVQTIDKNIDQFCHILTCIHNLWMDKLNVNFNSSSTLLIDWKVWYLVVGWSLFSLGPVMGRNLPLDLPW